MRRQFVLDKKSNRLLEQLAADRDGNYSRVVRQALEALSEQEARFERMESDPAFVKMMERSEADFRAGRFISHEDLMRETRTARRKSPKRR